MHSKALADALQPTLEQLQFQQDVFFYLGLIYFAIFVYWVASIWKRITEGVGFAVLVGLGFAALACIEWGFGLFGTALPLGMCIGLGMVNPSAATCLLVSSLFLRPWELIPNDPYLGMLPRLSLALCFAHLILRYAVQQRFDFDLSKTAAAIIGFTVWCLITTVFAPEAANSAGEFFGVFIKSVVVYFLIVAMVNAREEFKRVVVTLLMSFLFVAMVSMFQSDAQGRLMSFGAFKNSNDIAALMVLILPFAFMTARNVRERLTLRTIGWLLTFSAIITIILSQSRGAMLAVAAMIGAALVMRLGRRYLIPITIGIGIVAIPAMMILANRSESDLAGSSHGRMTYIKAGLSMGLRNPIFGVGFNGYPVSLAQYSTDSLEEEKNMTAHNSWILVFAESGFLGALLFTSIFLLSARSALRLYPVAPEFMIALVGYGLTMVFLSHSYLIYPFLLYGMIRAAENYRRIEIT